MKIRYRGHTITLELDQAHHKLYGSLDGRVARLDHHFLQTGLDSLIRGFPKTTDGRVYYLV